MGRGEGASKPPASPALLPVLAARERSFGTLEGSKDGEGPSAVIMGDTSVVVGCVVLGGVWVVVRRAPSAASPDHTDAEGGRMVMAGESGFRMDAVVTEEEILLGARTT